ncbi:lysophospholipid acyltransferase family protein [Deinococcus aquaticus]|uniref:lysophospholipid acyltransferase family protein n=1 Tax=Deinococcus aquaticus TaxID=328692 RepID=UPI0036194112
MSEVARPDLNGSGSPDHTASVPAARTAPEPAAPRVIPSVYRFVVNVTYLPVLASGMHLEVHGREHVPVAGTPLVVAANHVSSLDPFLVARALPHGRFMQFMAKKELFVPLVGDIIRAGGRSRWTAAATTWAQSARPCGS